MSNSNNNNSNFEKAIKASLENEKKAQNTRKRLANNFERATKASQENANAKLARRLAGLNLVNRPRGEPVKIKPTLTNGDCFFSAIYRAAIEQNLLGPMKECHSDLEISNERDFIQSLRDIVARNSPSHVKNLYNTLRGWYEANNSNSKNSLNAIMGDTQGFDRWHKDLINKYVLVDRPNLDKFKSEFKDGLRQKGHYSADVEVGITKQIFEICNILIYTHSSEKTTLPRMRDGNNVIHVSNPGAGHYEFYSFNTGSKRPNTRRNNAPKSPAGRNRSTTRRNNAPEAPKSPKLPTGQSVSGTRKSEREHKPVKRWLW